MTDTPNTLADASEAGVEEELQRRGKVAPRLTPEHINGRIAKVDYYVFPGTTMTVCCLTLKNGFRVIGQSAAASPANFDEEIGRTIALRNARDNIWQLEGYLLRSELAGDVMRVARSNHRHGEGS